MSISIAIRPTSSLRRWWLSSSWRRCWMTFSAWRFERRSRAYAKDAQLYDRDRATCLRAALANREHAQYWQTRADILREQLRRLPGHAHGARCWQCHDLIEDNDDAGVCIHCGGRNLRLRGAGTLT